MNPILWLIILTLMPFLELRASIPYGIFQAELPWIWVFVICVVVNILLAPIVFFFYKYLIHIFLKVKVIDRCYKKVVLRTQKKINPFIERWGILGLALFIGVPLPGSGVYTGALGAYLLGFKFRHFMIASILGVLIAGTVVTIVSLTGYGAWVFLK
ncbi:COG2426 family protein [Nanoarchaeota archaeon]